MSHNICQVLVNFKGYFGCYKMDFVIFKFINEKLRYGHFTAVVIKSLSSIYAITMSHNDTSC